MLNCFFLQYMSLSTEVTSVDQSWQASKCTSAHCEWVNRLCPLPVNTYEIYSFVHSQ